MSAPVAATVRTPGRVEVEFRGRASLRLRIAHALLRATLRPAVDALSVLAERTPLRGDPAFRIANAADLAAYPLLSARSLAVPALIGFARDGILDPMWSPVNHDFAGMPPTLIQVSDSEVLLPDAEALARRCAEAGVPHTLQIWNNAIHVFHAGADVLPDARAAIADLADFVRRALDSGAVAGDIDRTTAA
ncbi:alpha/beta hydrolase [Nocardia otitidiscaviarum]|uniref:Alpha/beta hydrolase n=1 Tax=Nocardia otitidiscaviarum TaxID=1823 RepID=A0A516NNS4_9NOCA|nr:alpha/beta hydrolase fold domain-containing protein [Nocardia otitidiscaviarum]MCP9624237.1 alpha/beta hydrolase [Nocardia otitidiscaviarum]QDP80525.1 alpha/beta hydrolase [Nocardia otitidiscaviarum]